MPVRFSFILFILGFLFVSLNATSATPTLSPDDFIERALKSMEKEARAKIAATMAAADKENEENAATAVMTDKRFCVAYSPGKSLKRSDYHHVVTPPDGPSFFSIFDGQKNPAIAQAAAKGLYNKILSHQKVTDDLESAIKDTFATFHQSVPASTAQSHPTTPGIVALIKDKRLYYSWIGKSRLLALNYHLKPGSKWTIDMLPAKYDEDHKHENMYSESIDLDPENGIEPVPRFLILASKGIWDAFYNAAYTAIKGTKDGKTSGANSGMFEEALSYEAAEAPVKQALSQATGAIDTKSLSFKGAVASTRAMILRKLGYQTAAAIVHEAFHRHNSCEAAANSLVNCASVHGGKDNMTAIVIDLRKLLNHTS